ncbi:hypothetical protein EXE46_15800 [Halorubrum sp. GN11_10-6_MGM]|uniref:DUF7504 family protein n=1 Tax=Halorubrum sp. GN11_10-6_MGM TaxID=2518112 RepID=UPI0010F4BA3F|nr:hypothetical protein [Halorubrum sp. GN11_10-6_MGM]TKX72482.1 hypothetical protein EXE46_15800 [Halorubrum sp. GN11_10-6_MGM]
MSDERGDEGERDDESDAETTQTDDRPSRFGEFRERLDETTAPDSNESLGPSAETDAGDNDTDETEASHPRLTEERSTEAPEDSWEWVGSDDEADTRGETDAARDGAHSGTSGGESDDEQGGDERPRIDDEDVGPRVWNADEADDEVTSSEPDATADDDRPAESGPDGEREGTDSAAEDEGRAEAGQGNSHRNEKKREKRPRIWDREDTHEGGSEAPTEPDTSGESRSEPLLRGGTASTSGSDLAAGPEEGYRRPAGLDLKPGTSALVECGSQDERKHAACQDLLGLETAAAQRDVLLVRYRRMDPEQLEAIASAAHRTKLVAIGYSQSVPEDVRDDVEVASINNPNDITRLGILISGTVESWAADDSEIVVCYDSVNILLKYKDVQSAFRFLHVFLGTLQGAGVIAHFHVDPRAGDPQNINTLKPLFDEVVSIDSVGVRRE